MTGGFGKPNPPLFFSVLRDLTEQGEAHERQLDGKVGIGDAATPPVSITGAIDGNVTLDDGRGASLRSS